MGEVAVGAGERLVRIGFGPVSKRVDSWQWVMLTVNTHLLCFELGYYQCLLYWTLFLSYVKSGGAMVLGASWQSGAPAVTSET